MSFDAIAPHYRWLEWVTAGPLLQRCRIEFIHEIQNAGNILLLGEGRGRFLLELLRLNHEARITCLDASARMLELTWTHLQKRGLSSNQPGPLTVRPCPSSSCRSTAVLSNDEGRGQRSAASHAPRNCIRFIHADIFSDTWTNGSERYDAIASHFFLDCFPPDQLAQVCEMVSGSAATGAVWLVSDFCQPERGWRRVRARWILALMYGFFRVITRLPTTRLTAPDARLQAAGFRLRARRYMNQGLLHTDLWVKAP